MDNETKKQEIHPQNAFCFNCQREKKPLLIEPLDCAKGVTTYLKNTYMV